MFEVSYSEFVAIFQVILIDLILAGDNAIVVGMAAAGVAPEYRKKVILYGIGLAVIMRIIFAGITIQLLNIVGLALVGGLLLLWVCWKLYRDLRLEAEAKVALDAGGDASTADVRDSSPKAQKTLRAAVIQVAIADISMSLDNVLAVAGAANNHMTALIIGLAFSVILMGIGATLIARLLQKYQWIGYIGLLLIEAGILEPEQLEQALLKQSKEPNSGYIGEVLISAGLIDEKTRNRFLSQQLHIPTVELGHFEVDRSVLGMIPERIVREYNVLPIFKLNNTLSVAIVDPIDSDPINAARNASGLKAEPLIVTANELQSAIDIYYGMSTLTSFEDEDIGIDDIDDTRIVQLVDNIIESSARYRSSDIHIETRESDIRVRFRIDGKLVDFQNLPVSIFSRDKKVMFNSSKAFFSNNW